MYYAWGVICLLTYIDIDPFIILAHNMHVGCYLSFDVYRHPFIILAHNMHVGCYLSFDVYRHPFIILAHNMHLSCFDYDG